MQFRRAKVVADDKDIFLCYPMIPILEGTTKYNNTMTVSKDPIFRSEKRYIDAPPANMEGSIAVTKGKKFFKGE